MRFFIIYIVLLVLSVLALGKSVEETQFEQFIARYSKTYLSNERAHRLKVFSDNLKRIQVLNEQEGNEIYGITQFADLSPEEFAHSFKMPNFVPATYEHKKNNLLPWNGTVVAPTADFDWKSKGAVTPVKNQGQCGSCWAFSTTETIESVWQIAGNPLTRLSVQQIVDCDGQDGGCNGGDTPTAYQYVINAGGLESEDDYSYTARDGRCHFDKSKAVAHISKWYYVTENDDEAKMLSVLTAKAPLSICVDASSWQFYNRGIIQKRCGRDLDHCVQITGYGTENGVDFWNIRNSWGTSWGESGFIRVERNKDLCGVGDEATLPCVSTC